jgi:60 kDa SS-A/Ro ribonucleoprotein
MEANMANKRATVAKAEAKNYVGAAAYSLSSRAALAQLAVTGCFNNTYYTKSQDQLDQVLTLARQSGPEFVAKVAVYARGSGFMKDMPAALVAYLSTVDAALCRKVFPRVIDNGKMLRNFVQMIRSGLFGRQNVSSATMRRMVQEWFNSRTDEQLFFQSVGSNPSLGDVLKMAHLRPGTLTRSALYAYLVGRGVCRFEGEVIKEESEYPVLENLPPLVRAYEEYRKNPEGALPRAPFEMLTGLQLSPANWKDVARQATWTQTFKSLNTFSRQKVFNDPEMVRLVAEKLQSREEILKAKAFPYQILMAFKAVSDEPSGLYGYRRGKTAKTPESSAELPKEILLALHTAMEVATENVPSFEGQTVVVCPDASGSMSSSYITGNRKDSTTKVRSIDVAALMAASLLRRNPSARVIPFEEGVCSVKLKAQDPILANAKILASVGGGGTNCAAPLALLNQERAKVDIVVFVSDYESWSGHYGDTRGTQMSAQWGLLKKRNPTAKLICIDATPHNTTQVNDQQDVLNVGGFSDAVYKVMEAFVLASESGHWTDMIEAVQL